MSHSTLDVAAMHDVDLKPHDGSGNGSFLQSYPSWEYSFDEYYAYYEDHVYEIFDFELTLYGYIWPILVLVTTFCNLLVIGGFLRKCMRSPTNLILVFIAVSDSLTGLVTLPATFHIFTGNNVFLTPDWCNAAMITRLYISRAFHTVSVLETLLLGTHRYLQVRHAELARKLCTTSKTLAMIAVIYILAFTLHVYHAFDIKVVGGFCVWELENPCGWSCVYIWCTLVLGYVVPCAGLVFLAVNMLKALNQFNTSVDLNVNVARRRERNRKVTLAVMLIVVIFLIPELPYAMFYLTTVILSHSKERIFPLRTNRIVHCIYELLLVLSFHLNFWVYCLVFKSFRNLLKGLVRLVTCRSVSFERLESDNSSSDSKDYELTGVESTARQE